MKKLSLTLSILTVIIFTLRAQEVKVTGYGTHMTIDSSTVVSLKEGADADVYINGKKYDTDVLEFLDKDKIETISVLKGEAAMKTYAAEKVIIITTKGYPGHEMKIRSTDQSSQYGKDDNLSDDSYVIRKVICQENPDIVIDGKVKGQENPVIVIDGEIKTESDLKKLSPDRISNIEVRKDEATLEKYKSTAGVILITTNDKKSRK